MGDAGTAWSHAPVGVHVAAQYVTMSQPKRADADRHTATTTCICSCAIITGACRSSGDTVPIVA